MPEWDESLSYFLGKEETLADFVNGTIYKGKQLLKLRETKKTEIERKRGKVDMCRAFDEILQDKKEEGIRIGEKTGEARGEKRGEKRGEERMRNLIGLLMKDGRTEDVLSAAQSVSACRKLYQEYGM